MTKISRIAATLASVAAFSMAATPAMARDNWGGGWGGWGGGWGRHYHHDHDIDAGDVLAGVLIIGGIAAIASAASKASRNRDTRPDYRYPDQRPDQRDSDRSYQGSGRDDRPEWGDSHGIGSAVDRCAAEVERGDSRVDSVDSVSRDGSGWRVDGRLTGGKDFSCNIDGDGRIRGVTLDGHAI